MLQLLMQFYDEELHWGKTQIRTVGLNETKKGGDVLGLIRSTLGLPFKAYAVICAPAAMICPPVAVVAMTSWMVGAGIAGDGLDE